MKIFIFFMLVGLSFCDGDDDNGDSNGGTGGAEGGPKSQTDCVKKIIDGSPTFFAKTFDEICIQLSDKSDDEKKQSAEAFNEEVKKFAGDAACPVKVVANVEQEAEEAGSTVHITAQDLIVATGLGKLKSDLINNICKSLTGVTKCIPVIIGALDLTNPENKKDLTDFKCESTMDKLLGAMEKKGCDVKQISEKLLKENKLNDETIGKITTIIDSAVKKLFENSAVKGVADTILCVGKNLVAAVQGVVGTGLGPGK